MKVVASGRQERDEVEAEVSALLDGFQFDHVEYLIPEPLLESGLTRGSGFEHAEAGVRLVRADGGCRTVRWFQRGEEEGLWIGAELATDESGWVPAVAPVVADSWETRGLGNRIARSVVSWQQLAPSRTSVWSIRLDLEGGAVAIALGESDYESRTPTYIPDCVIVIFDPNVGRGYRPVASANSAWALGGAESDG